MTHDCKICNDTGNAPNGFEHPGYDLLGCPKCNDPDGIRCCEAIPNKIGLCENCEHPVGVKR